MRVRNVLGSDRGDVHRRARSSLEDDRGVVSMGMNSLNSVARRGASRLGQPVKRASSTHRLATIKKKGAHNAASVERHCREGTMPPSRADYYRTKANECEQKAKKARDPVVKRDFFELARQWREVAEQVERARMDLIINW
jgi:hypothetical protein